MEPSLVVALFSLLGATFSAAVPLAEKFLEEPRVRRFLGLAPIEEQESLDERISRLTRALEESTQLISTIESEIAQRQDLVRRLESDVQTYNQLAQLREAEVEAVAQTLRSELDRQGKKEFWQQVAMNFFFFMLGVGATIVIDRIFG